jgi:hypothetical protein
MKYFFPVLMSAILLSVAAVVATPYIAEMLLPLPETRYQTANPVDVKQALADWSGATSDAFSEVNGIKRLSPQGSTSWFAFTVARQPIENFIRKHHLQQQALTPEYLQTAFNGKNPPASWWQPASLERQTCFIGTQDGNELGLIYDAERQRGFLIVRMSQQPNKF